MGTEEEKQPTMQECFAQAASTLRNHGSPEEAREWRILGEVIYRADKGF